MPATVTPRTPVSGQQPTPRTPGSPEWVEAAENRLRRILELQSLPETSTDPNEDTQQRHLGEIESLQEAVGRDYEADQNSWLEMSARVQGVTPDSSEADKDSALNQALDMLNSILGGGGSTSTSRTSQEDIERREAQKRTTVDFIEMPTPEKFLDDFNVAWSTHVTGLAKAGAIDRNTAAWLIDNPDRFLSEYLSALGEKAARGEQVYKVTGVGGKETLVGERMGPYTGESKSLGAQVSNLVSKQTETELEGTGGATTSALTSKEVQRTQEYQSTENLEKLYARPLATTEQTPSPLEWLQQAYSAKSLEMVYQGTRGRKQAEYQTALGPPSILPRRVQ